MYDSLQIINFGLNAVHMNAVMFSMLFFLGSVFLIKFSVLLMVVIFVVYGLEEFSEYSGHLVVPVDSHEQALSFGLNLSRLQIFDQPFDEYLPAFSLDYLSLEYIELILPNRFLILHTQLCGHHHLLTIQYGQLSHILVDDRGGGSPVLNFRMPADIFSWAKYAINMLYLPALVFYLLCP